MEKSRSRSSKNLFTRLKWKSSLGDYAIEVEPESGEESQGFLASVADCGELDERHISVQLRYVVQRQERRLWFLLTLLLGTLLALTTSVLIKVERNDQYAAGFATDLAVAKTAIRLKETKFFGGIVVNDGNFSLVLDPDAPTQFVGRPTQQLDDAWDRIVGSYIALSPSDAASIQGARSIESGSFYVVPHVRHSLHCLNYLRKAIYHTYYPGVITENKPTVPTFFMHVDHCVETLRETLQCNADMTPVPHVWSASKNMYIANTMLTHTCRDFDAIMQWQDGFHSS